jgi:hypothetical protein
MSGGSVGVCGRRGKAGEAGDGSMRGPGGRLVRKDGTPAAKCGRKEGSKVDYIGTGFRMIQLRLLRELKVRTEPGELKKMSMVNIGSILRTCNENMKAMHQHKLANMQDSRIEFVTRAPMEKKASGEN